MNRNIKMLALILAVMMFITSFAGAVSAAELVSGEGDEAIAEAGAAKPDFTSVEPAQGGIKLSWSKVDGVSAYCLDRYFDDGRGWVTIAQTGSLYYVDTNVAGGNTYKYRLVGVNSSGTEITPSVTTAYSYVAPPEIVSAAMSPDGITVKWTKPEGVGYIELLRKDGGAWKSLKSFTNETSYTDKTATSSGVYTYTVRGLDKNGDYMYGFFDEEGVSVKRLATPELTASNAAGGVLVGWKAVDRAEAYRVFVKKSGGSWTALGDTTQTSFLDSKAVSGNSYTYTVRCVSADGRVYESYYDTAGKTVDYIAAPVLKAANCTNSGITLSWEKSEGADKYRVFVKNAENGWSRLGDTASTSMNLTNCTAGETYVFTVRCLASDGSYCSSFYSDGISATYLTPPEFTVACGAKGVDIKWEPVKGAVNYRVYYYGSKGWTKLTETSETSVTDTDVLSNYTYTYTVRCINVDGTAFTSGHLAGKSVRYIAAPVVSMTNVQNGVKLSWAAVSGAEKYRVYYYGSKGWTRMTDTTSTSYLDTDVASGYNYIYTVRCLNSAATAFTSYFQASAKHMYVAPPAFTLNQTIDGIVVSWPQVKGAARYRVYRYGENGWAKLTDTVTTSYTDKDVESGETYKYTVRCLNEDSTKAVSDYLAGKSVRYLEAPKITSAAANASGVNVVWKAVEGASKYRVYHKTGDSGWTRIAETTATSFVDTTAESGKTYIYTVRCVNAAGTAFESWFYEDGVAVNYIAAPKNIKAVCYKNSIKISWDKSEGAAKYRVYYYGSKGWTRLALTSDTSVIDNDVSSGYKYRYTVRCVSQDGETFTSDFDRNGAVCEYNAMPVLNTPECTSEGVKLTWKKPSAKAKFRVYYYGDNGWTRLGETSENSFVDTIVNSGETYRYTVRCISADGKSFASDYDAKGVSVLYVEAPKLANMESTTNSITITWTKPEGSSRYRVYKLVNGSWKRLTETTSNKYTDTDVYVGGTYTYTVRCLSSDGKSFISGFDPNGFIFTISGEDFCYYDQTQYDYPYGDDTIAYSGCGPTCFAMVASTILDKSVTPIDAVKWCGNDYYVENVGTMWSYFEDASAHFGVGFEGQTYDIDDAVAALKKGKYVISSHGPGRFTRGGHFIVMSGVDANGKIVVYDPNGGNHFVGTSFTAAEINESATSFWIFGKK